MLVSPCECKRPIPEAAVADARAGDKELCCSKCKLTFKADAATSAPDELFDGKTYDPALDGDRLRRQLGRTWEALRNGEWLTLFELSVKTADPEASLSARIRDLRKEKFGSYKVLRRRRDGEGGLWEYRMVM